MIEFIIKTNRLFDKAIYCEIVKLLEEYNIDTSAQHPTDEGDDIVRAYAKDKYKNQEIKNS